MTTLTPHQITQYLTRLQIPPSHPSHHPSITSLSAAQSLAYLTLLLQHHLTHIPFENLSLHYSPHHQISIQPDFLFGKIIGDDNGRGGYCMENNTLFGVLLRSLGYRLYAAGARVWEADGRGQWTGWSHMVNLVTIDGVKYHVDVGFGSEGPVVPMRLEREGGVEEEHVLPSRARLQWAGIPGTTDEGQKMWVYSYLRDEETGWNMRYCFTETEFMAGDYAVMNYFTSTSPRIFFTRTVVAEKKIMREGKLVGNLILGGREVKWRVNGVKEKAIQFESEEDRLRALEEWFGIKFGKVEREGIRGMASEVLSLGEK